MVVRVILEKYENNIKLKCQKVRKMVKEKWPDNHGQTSMVRHGWKTMTVNCRSIMDKHGQTLSDNHDHKWSDSQGQIWWNNQWSEVRLLLVDKHGQKNMIEHSWLDNHCRTEPWSKIIFRHGQATMVVHGRTNMVRQTWLDITGQNMLENVRH